MVQFPRYSFINKYKSSGQSPLCQTFEKVDCPNLCVLKPSTHVAFCSQTFNKLDLYLLIKNIFLILFVYQLFLFQILTDGPQMIVSSGRPSETKNTCRIHYCVLRQLTAAAEDVKRRVYLFQVYMVCSFSRSGICLRLCSWWFCWSWNEKNSNRCNRELLVYIFDNN